MKLRPMTMADADKMLEWKNYDETRSFAIASSEPVKRENHIKWLEKNVQFFKVIEFKDESVGAFRIQDDEISIWVDRAFRDRNIATQTLKEVSYLGMRAKIVSGNIASMRAFIAAGFSPVEYHATDPFKTYYVFQKS